MVNCPILRASQRSCPHTRRSYVNELTRLVLLDPFPDKTFVTRYVCAPVHAGPPVPPENRIPVALELQAEPPMPCHAYSLQAGPQSIGV
jgi:hypothetical protein